MNNIQQGFVNIKTVFSEKAERTVEALQQLYNDHPYLLTVVETLSDKVLTEENVSGKRVLLKPNWVKHSYKPFDPVCLYTNDHFLLAVLELVLSKRPASVVIGDAPIQGCHWNKVVTKDLISKIDGLASAYKVPVTIKDFRRVVFDTAANNVDVERNAMSEYVIFDVGKKSYLEPITIAEKNLFRVSQYDPDKFIHTHKPGMHKYCITKELFSADIVISLPKVKTHQKSGITCALKNIVGLNGDKDFLPHHRIGGTGKGGDSYPGNNRLRYWSELALDNANRKKGKSIYWFWIRLSSLLWKISMPKKNHQLSAAWFGNDTTWRMVMDLNMIINYGRADGTLADHPQRFLYSFCDGIVGGQGDGPLRPDPLNLGVVCFSDDSATTDVCMATLMGLKIEKLPLLMAAKAFMPDRKIDICLDGNPIQIAALEKYITNAIPPPGWEIINIFMLIAIHLSVNSFSDRWITYCQQNSIQYRIVNCYSDDIVAQLKGCDALLWHHHQGSPKDILFAKQLLYSVQQMGMSVFPDFNTGWHFDDKVGQKYLLEMAGIPAVASYVFYSKKEALMWVSNATFPKVFKLRGGAGSANVKLAKDQTAAIKLVHQAFSAGFSQYMAYDNLKERYRKYKKGKATAKDLLKGVIRFAIPPEYSKVSGKEIGYIYFQEFIANNDHDIRVIVIGDKAFAIKRMVRENDFRASGSGNILYDKELFDEGTIQLSFDIAKKLKTQCIALDYVYDNGSPLVVEISYGFSMVGYDPCPGYWNSNMQWHEGKFNPYGWMIDDVIKSL